MANPGNNRGNYQDYRKNRNQKFQQRNNNRNNDRNNDRGGNKFKKKRLLTHGSVHSFEVIGGRRLKGEITPQGAKNEKRCRSSAPYC